MSEELDGYVVVRESQLMTLEEANAKADDLASFYDHAYFVMKAIRRIEIKRVPFVPYRRSIEELYDMLEKWIDGETQKSIGANLTKPISGTMVGQYICKAERTLKRRIRKGEISKQEMRIVEKVCNAERDFFSLSEYLDLAKEAFQNSQGEKK